MKTDSHPSLPSAAPDQRAHDLRSTRHRERLLCAFAVFLVLFFSRPACAGGPDSGNLPYKVLPPIVRGNLAIFPVLAAQSPDASQFITLDEGVRTGQVTVTEAGQDRAILRPGQPIPPRNGAEINRLVLYNNSPHPLLLLAGEIVTGGKQDRVIGSDRIVPANGGPIDLGVFCVEPGRWVGSSSGFGSMGKQMAQPSIRTSAMAERNQAEVWANVRSSHAKVAAMLQPADAASIDGTTSYAQVFSSAPVAKAVAQYGGAESDQAILRELRKQGAVGVVVAVNGHVEWADIFAGTDLLARYWPKLVSSYIAEALTSPADGAAPGQRDAEQFIGTLKGGREVVETEAGIFRRADITGDGYRVFELTSLLPKTGFVVHVTKMLQQ